MTEPENLHNVIKRATPPLNRTSGLGRSIKQRERRGWARSRRFVAVSRCLSGEAGFDGGRGIVRHHPPRYLNVQTPRRSVRTSREGKIGKRNRIVS